jgi:hypothetical protein
MGLAYGGAIVRDGLVLALDAADRNSYPGTGTTWYDLSGNNLNGTLVNTPTYSSDFNGTLLFDGVNERVNVTASSLIQNLTTNFTFQAFVRFNTSGGQYGIFTKGSTFTDGWTVYVRQGPQFALIGHNESNVSSGLLAPTPSGGISTNTWYQITYTYDNTVVRSYIDGVQSSTESYSETFDSIGTSPYIGWGPSVGTPKYWPGNISNTTLYNRALTASEVLQNYNATKSRFGL